MAEEKVDKKMAGKSVTCVGDICYNPQSNTLRFEVSGKCKPKDIQAITEAVTKGKTEVEIVLPTRSKKKEVE